MSADLKNKKAGLARKAMAEGFIPTSVLPSRFVAILDHNNSQVLSKSGVIGQDTKNAMQQQQNRCRGFTLTELIVTLGIVAVIATVVLSGQSNYTDGIALSNLAEEVSLTVSQAQTFSIGVREFMPGSGEFSSSFGLAFSLRSNPNGDQYSYIYFADRDNGKTYNNVSWTCTIGGASECISKPQITRGNYIHDICALTGSSLTEDCSPGRVDITFSRPSTEASIRFYAMNGSVYTPSNLRGVRIKLRSPRATERSVSVFTTGQISVQ